MNKPFLVITLDTVSSVPEVELNGVKVEMLTDVQFEYQTNDESSRHPNQITIGWYEQLGHKVRIQHVAETI
ncbi:hypothetical protein A374_08799 [Fictibacillus macauensis ZFHKF-1]|uniref:Uncharacterized protein n=1 Tax=Fictibacillus macauensis ZFHKF-1 TaxID=1196324 RepID=I8J2F3_9BACL|nr:hypothetical protein [Fictibacillus macauensis]EIT85921.1 hypothetical protein A374_08799 [Fictibacillus macauensis ZFHKF-1]